MTDLPLAMAHPILLWCGIGIGTVVLVVVVLAIPDIIRYIRITWM